MKSLSNVKHKTHAKVWRHIFGHLSRPEGTTPPRVMLLYYYQTQRTERRKTNVNLRTTRNRTWKTQRNRRKENMQLTAIERKNTHTHIHTQPGGGKWLMRDNSVLDSCISQYRAQFSSRKPSKSTKSEPHWVFS